MQQPDGSHSSAVALLLPPNPAWSSKIVPSLATAALGLWLGLQVAVLLVGKLYMSDEVLAPADSGTRPDWSSAPACELCNGTED